MNTFDIHQWQRRYLVEDYTSENENNVTQEVNTSIESLGRMDGLVSQTALKAYQLSISTILKELSEEGFSEEEIVDYLLEKMNQVRNQHSN